MCDDGRRFLLYYLILTLPHILEVATNSQNTGFVLGLRVLQYFLEIVILLLIGERLIGRFRGVPYRLAAKERLKFFTVQFLYWLLLRAPLHFLPVVHDLAKLLILVLYVPFAIFTLRYLFIFFPMLIEPKSPLKDVFREARALTRANYRLPLQTITPALGSWLFLTTLVHAISPDLRHIEVGYMLALCNAIFWLLCAYLSFAAYLVRAREEGWQKLNATQNVRELLAGCLRRSDSFLPGALRPAVGLMLLAISFFLISPMNMWRWMNLAPAANIALMQKEVGSDSVRLTLKLSDERFRFRGLFLWSFKVASESGVTVVSSPFSITINGLPHDILLPVPQENTAATIVLEFKAPPDSRDLSSLEDLYLWYNMVKLYPLRESGAK